MTKDTFRTLCEQVLVPRIGDLMYRQLADLHETTDIIARELMRMNAKLDHIASRLPPDGNP